MAEYRPVYGEDYFEWAVCYCKHCDSKYLIDKDDFKRCVHCEYKDQEIIKEGRVDL